MLHEKKWSLKGKVIMVSDFGMHGILNFSLNELIENYCPEERGRGVGLKQQLNYKLQSYTHVNR